MASHAALPSRMQNPWAEAPQKLGRGETHVGGDSPEPVRGASFLRPSGADLAIGF